MTPEQRIAAIRSDLTERNMEYPLGARDAWWLLRYAEALCDVAVAAERIPEPLHIRSGVSGNDAITVCDLCWESARGEALTLPRHKPTCPWLLLQSALQRWKGVAGA